MITLVSSKKLQSFLITLGLGLLVGVVLWHPLQGFQTTPIQITIAQVSGLETELALRPTMGVNYTPGAVAYIDSSTFLEAVPGAAGNCVTVAAQSVPCGGSNGTSGSSTINFADSEIPSGAVNNLNTTYSLAHAPNPTSSLHLFRNGMRLSLPADYGLTGTTGVIVLTVAPGIGDQIIADYRY